MGENTKTKEEIRKELLKRRAGISFEAWEQMSMAIEERVLSHPWFRETSTVYGYLSYKREVHTWFLLSEALKMGKRVAVPKVLGSEMEFYYIENLSELSLGTMGIFEPEGKKYRLATEERAFVLMPLVGYDKKRNRLGYGGGYYDKYLKRYPGHRTMGLAFSLQETDRIPSETTDWKPDIILTEKKEV